MLFSELERCLGIAGSGRGDSDIVDIFDAERCEFRFCRGANRTGNAREKGLVLERMVVS